MPLTNSNSALSAEEFYQRRDDRTRKCLTGHLPPHIHCVLSIEDGWEQAPASHAALQTLCNLTARYCRRVSIFLTPMQQKIVNSKKLLRILKVADPYGEFVLVNEPLASDLELRLGSSPFTSLAAAKINYGYLGWKAFIAAGICPYFAVRPNSNSVHSPGAEMSACLAGAAAFRCWVEGNTSQLNSFGLDLLNLTEIRLDEFHLDAPLGDMLKEQNILLVGAGSVGSSAAYFLPRLGFRGNVDIVEHDKIEIENISRSPLFEIQHDGQNKAAIVATYLRSLGVNAKEYPMTWDEFVRNTTELPRNHDIWLPLANEHGVRRAMQSNVPPLCLQASTGRSWIVNFGRHIPFKDDCQLDRFPEEPTAPLICANASIPTLSGKKVDAALPFASFTAGLFVAAAVMRAALGKIDLGENAACLSFQPTFSLWVDQRSPRPECICQEMNRGIWERVWHSPQNSVSRQNQPSGMVCIL